MADSGTAGVEFEQRFRHRARRPQASRAVLRPAARAQPAGGVPAGADPHRRRFRRSGLALASNPEAPRRVLAIDYRGRGLSDYDRDPRNYSLATELADLRAVLTALDVAPAVFIGTSRGGILTMLLASAQPTAIAGAVLNDIGPVIEPTGLARIKSYVGKLPQPKSFEEGAEIFRRLFGQHFTRLTDEEWLAYSRRSFKIEQHRLVPTYDVHLAKTMEGIDFDRPLPPMWPQFDSLGRVPLDGAARGRTRTCCRRPRSRRCGRGGRRWKRSRCRTRATRRS